MAARQALIIPPLKGEVGEQSEPGGVGCNSLARRIDPTLKELRGKFADATFRGYGGCYGMPFLS